MYFVRRRYLSIIFAIDVFGSAYSKLKLVFVEPKLLNKTRVKKIAIMALDLIGDGILAIPAIRTVRKNFPNADIAVFAGLWNKEIFENNPDIDKVRIIDPFWTRSNSLSFWQKIKSFAKIYFSLKKENFDLGIDLRGEFLSILLLKRIGAKFSTGYGITGGGWLLDKCADYEGGRFAKHIVERNLDILKALDLKNSESLDLAIYPNRKNKENIDKFLSDNGIRPGEKVILIHPGSNDQARCWENEKWAETIVRLAKKYRYKIILSEGPGDARMVEDIKSKIKNQKLKKKSEIMAASLLLEEGTREGMISDFRFPISFLGFSILDLAELMKRSSLVICVNSAPLHIAAAQKIPAVVLFSGSYPKTYGPWQNPKSIVLFKNAKCFPCGKSICGNNICMKEIEVDEVAEAAGKLLDGKNNRD